MPSACRRCSCRPQTRCHLRRELEAAASRYPVVIGGAAIHRGFGRASRSWTRSVYEGGVYYCNDAFEGLETVDRLIDPDRRDALLTRVREEARVHREREREKLERRSAAAQLAPPRCRLGASVRRDAPIPTVPFWGARVLRDIPIWDVYPHHRSQLALQDELAVPRRPRSRSMG